MYFETFGKEYCKYNASFNPFCNLLIMLYTENCSTFYNVIMHCTCCLLYHTHPYPRYILNYIRYKLNKINTQKSNNFVRKCN